jgi:hypothetical protein
VPAASQAEFDSVVANAWTACRPTANGWIDQALAGLPGTMLGPVKVDSVTIASLDISSPPRILITSPTLGNVTQVEFMLPRDSWQIAVTAHVEYTASIFGLSTTITADVTIALSNVQATETLAMDATDPTLPIVSQAGTIQVNYNLGVTTTNPILQALLPAFQPTIKSYVDNAIQNAIAPWNAIFASTVGQPKAIWGVGAPPRPPFPLKPDLQAAALEISNDIQTVNTPYGGILIAFMSDPTYGQGVPLHWDGYADSAIWTGHYLAAESFRYAVTKDPLALANAGKALAAIEDMLDAENPGGGHLCRCVVPASEPDAAMILQTQPANAFTSTVRGQNVVCMGYITRDQYLGVMHGLACAYDNIDDPATKQLAGSLIERIVDYISGNSWVVMRHDNTHVSVVYCMNPTQMIAFTAIAAHVNPAKYQTLRDQVGLLAPVSWVLGMADMLNPLESYYKNNLEMGATYHALRLETDPVRRAQLTAAHAIVRRVIGHHENAYFQAIDCALDPSLAPTLAPEILDELRRFASRGGTGSLDRREFTVTNSTDPSILTGNYTSLFGSSTHTVGQGTTSGLEALYPVPVEKRPCTDFLWQRDPFELDAQGDPTRQAPGIDLLLPYWMGRYYGLLK